MKRYSGTLFYKDCHAKCKIVDQRLTIIFSLNDIKRYLLKDKEENFDPFNDKIPIDDFNFKIVTDKESEEIYCYCYENIYEQKPQLGRKIKVFVTLLIKNLAIFDLKNKIHTNSSNNSYMVYLSNQIHKFTNILSYNTSYINQSINFDDYLELKPINKFDLDFIKCSLNPVADVLIGKNGRINLTPGIKLCIEKILDIEEINKIYTSFLKFMKYSLMRNDLFPDKFVIINGNKIGIMLNFYNIKYLKEDLSSKHLNCLSWEILNKNAGNLFNLIYSNELYIHNIPETIGDRYVVSLETISKDSAAFESGFDNLRIQINHSNSTIQARKNAKDKIENLKNDQNINRTEKDIYGFAIKQIDHEPLETKINTAFNKYRNCLISVKSILSYNISDNDVAKLCIKARNAVDHGHLNYLISKEDANSFILLRCLIVAMQLSKAGFAEDEIDELIKRLYN